MVEAARSILDALPENVAPLTEAALALLGQPGDLLADGTLYLGHRLWVAPENYAMTLYPGLPAETLRRYADRFELEIPDVYAGFLMAVNGAFWFGMSLAGVPRSMLGSPLLLDRRRLQCHDLGMTATSEALEYRKVSEGAFHFGGRHYSYRENVGYFIAGGRIVSLRVSGKIVGESGDLSDFLSDELRASAALDAKLKPPGSAR